MRRPPPLLRRARLAASVLPWRIRRGADAARFAGFGRAEAVTLDVFDTALFRTVARPVDAFALAAWRVGERRGSPVDVDRLARVRLDAEEAARVAARASGRSEVTLDEVYEHLPASVEAGVAEALRREELATEQDVCFANQDILDLYRELVERGVRVAFVSDIYLDPEFVAHLLVSKGYTAGSHEVFVSSRYGKSKSHGDLFPVVARALGVAPGRIWHIGDNPRADVLRARQAGWNGLWYRPRLPPGALARARDDLGGDLDGDLGGDVGERIAASLLAGIPVSLADRSGRQPPAAVVWSGIGHGVAGPIYLGLVQWLVERMAQFGPDRVAFCARDGRIIRIVYSRLAERAGCWLPPSTYLMVSRRSLVFPVFERVGEVELDFLCGQFAPLQVHEFLTRIGLDPGALAARVEAHGLALHTSVTTPGLLYRLRDLFRDLEPEVVAVARRERSLLERYLAQEGCLDAGRLALVDVGWQGTMQSALSEVFTKLGHSPRLSGYYFGTSPKIAQIGPHAGSAEGWFVNAGEPAERYRVTRTQWAILELLFTAPHGSVLGYTERDGVVEAILQSEDDGELPPYERASAAIQTAALDFVDRYVAAFGGLAPLRISADAVAPKLERLVFNPSLAQAAVIGDLFHVDGFGATRTGQHIAKPPHPLRLLRSPSAAAASYRQASWRRGYLVRLFGGPRPASIVISAIRAIRPNFKSE